MKLQDFKRRVNVCFKSNDVRCIAGKELDSEIAYRVGKALVSYLKAKEVIVGRDMRVSSLSLRDSFIRGIRDQGVDVIDIGMIDSPGLYFASGFLGKAGGMITASHNPAKYNGIKLVRAGAVPIGEKSGLKEIKGIIARNKFGKVGEKEKRGKLEKRDIGLEYRKYVQSFVNAKTISGLKVVVDAGNGMAGKIVPIVYKGLGIKINRLGFKLDGSFPNHEANPAKIENIRDLMARVKKENADFGIAFDGDMDRVFFVDEKGRRVDSSIIAALLIKNLCSRKNVVYNTVMSKIVPEITRKYGGKAFKEKVGHVNIKARMRKEKAVFGAELSAHYYYKKNWYADSGLISSLKVCEIFSCAKKKGLKFSEMLKEFEKYHKIEETSLKIKDKDRVIKAVEGKYGKVAKRIERKDGLTMEFDWGWFNVRASNTEPLLRLNLEADSKEMMIRKKKEVLGFISRK